MGGAVVTAGSMILKVTNNDQTGYELNILKLADGKAVKVTAEPTQEGVLRE